MVKQAKKKKIKKNPDDRKWTNLCLILSHNICAISFKNYSCTTATTLLLDAETGHQTGTKILLFTSM